MRRWRGPAALCSLLLLGWSSEYFLPIAALVCLCRICQVKDLKSILFVSVPLLFSKYFFSWGHVVKGHVPSTGTILTFHYGESGNVLADPYLKAVTLVFRLLLAYSLYWLVGRIPASSSGRKIILLHATLLAWILICGGLLEYYPASASLVLPLLVSFCGYFFALCIIALENPNLKASGFYVLYIAPFWDNQFTPRPKMDIQPQDDKRDLLDARCLRLALLGSALMLGGSLLEAFVYSKNFHGHPLPFSMTPLPRLDNTGLQTSIFLVYSRWHVLLSVLWRGCYRITNYIALLLFLECCYLALSYDVPRRFSIPFRANSFGQFYNAIMPYYVMLLDRIYLHPLYFYLRKRGWNRVLAYDLGLCFAVTAGGLIIHLVRDVHLVGLFGAGDYLWRYLIYGLPYFFLLFAAARWVHFPPFLAKILPSPIKFSILLILYTLILSTSIGGIFVSWEQRFRFFKALYLGVTPVG